MGSDRVDCPGGSAPGGEEMPHTTRPGLAGSREPPLGSPCLTQWIWGGIEEGGREEAAWGRWLVGGAKAISSRARGAGMGTGCNSWGMWVLEEGLQ